MRRHLTRQRGAAGAGARTGDGDDAARRARHVAAIMIAAADLLGSTSIGVAADRFAPGF
jgi:hypothetical protein